MAREDERILEQFTSRGLGASPFAQREVGVSNLANLGQAVSTSQATRRALDERRKADIQARTLRSLKPRRRGRGGAALTQDLLLNIGQDIQPTIGTTATGASPRAVANFAGFNPFGGVSGFRNIRKLAQDIRDNIDPTQVGRNIGIFAGTPAARTAFNELRQELAGSGFNVRDLNLQDFTDQQRLLTNRRKAAGQFTGTRAFSTAPFRAAAKTARGIAKGRRPQAVGESGPTFRDFQNEFERRILKFDQKTDFGRAGIRALQRDLQKTQRAFRGR